MTNAKSVNNCFIATKYLAVMKCTDRWVDRLKFITNAVILNVLPFFDTEPRNVRNEIRS